MGMIILCSHCGTQTSGKYCPQCKTKEGRKEMDEANNQLWKEKLGKEYICEKCLED